LSTLVSYTWSKSIDVSSGTSTSRMVRAVASTIQNFGDPSTARGVSSYDITHFLSWATIYEFPFGKGKEVVPERRGLLAAGQLAGELHYAGALGRALQPAGHR
jgi:hypothetical protein